VELVRPKIPFHPAIRAFTTTRSGGTSKPPYDTFNLAEHVGDAPSDVASNRALLSAAQDLPHAPRWLNQVHGSVTVHAGELDRGGPVSADAAYSDTPDQICAILTADCLPIVLAAEDGTEVAVVHAGWRGLLSGVVAECLAEFSAPRPRISAWIGPGISAEAYTVDEAFRARFVERNSAFAPAFRVAAGTLQADLYAIADYLLREAGIERIDRYEGCTYREPRRFYSYRRERTTGRMATLAWIACGTT